MLKGKWHLFIDQYGERYSASTVAELRARVGNGGSRVERMYKDKPDGAAAHIGYVIGGRWLRAYRPVEVTQ